MGEVCPRRRAATADDGAPAKEAGAGLCHLPDETGTFAGLQALGRPGRNPGVRAASIR